MELCISETCENYKISEIDPQITKVIRCIYEPVRSRSVTHERILNRVKPATDCTQQAASVEQRGSNTAEFCGSVSSGVENISSLIGCCSTLAACCVQSVAGLRRRQRYKWQNFDSLDGKNVGPLSVT
ncbi:PREDICTED: uncharacterized protein LOC105560820 [Vollenhovia emeryi]|uniref:uncharacterized protein LOC105560820 n=1 Tax=Vollenhovia emeryi TaxID=411798 RepID=UPI0005F3C74C|nr:PREDICTED: uncharacterized protein LOC105560820 [Vollenhovia emeryi]